MTIAQPVEVTTQYAVEEKKKLKKRIGRLDILFFLLCTIVGFDTIGSTAASGGQAFTWMLFLGVFFFFFFPYALMTSELGSAFREEGGAYEWVKLAFGRRSRRLRRPTGGIAAGRVTPTGLPDGLPPLRVLNGASGLGEA